MSLNNSEEERKRERILAINTGGHVCFRGNKVNNYGENIATVVYYDESDGQPLSHRRTEIILVSLKILKDVVDS